MTEQFYQESKAQKKIQLNLRVDVTTKNQLLSLVDGLEVCSLSDAVKVAANLAYNNHLESKS